jgi:RNA polymerase sigma-70 factor (ECF subfamily)
MGRALATLSREPQMQPVDVETELAKLHEESFGWALACAGWDQAEADEVLQAAYLKVLDGRARFGRRSEFRTWLFGVIRLTAREHRRRRWLRQRLTALLPAGWTAPSAALDPEAALAQARESAELIGALRALTERQREVLALVFYHGLTLERAAQVLGMPLGTARTHYARGKARLRELLAEAR